MHVSYTLLIAVALWVASCFIAPAPPASADRVPALGIAGSAYGSLVARTMRGPLYAYWHGGEQNQARPPAPGSSPPPPTLDPAAPATVLPPAASGVFSRRRLRAGSSNVSPEPPVPNPITPPLDSSVMEGTAPSGSLLETASALVSRLETARTKRQGQFATSAAHLRFISASADWRLRLAYHLDPGDTALYEILHDHVLSTARSEADARAAARSLAKRALERALSDQAGVADALTGAGAAMNLLNEAMDASRPGGASRAETTEAWDAVTRCQERYNKARQAAVSEGWWDSIPELRRLELDTQAQFIANLATKFRQNLTARGFQLTPEGSH